MDLRELSMEYGVRNLRFFAPMSKLQYAGVIPGIAFRTSNSPEEIVECVISESRYKVLDGYKITLRAVNPEYGQEHYYQSDLESIIRNNPDRIRVYVITIDGYTQIHNKEFEL